MIYRCNFKVPGFQVQRFDFVQHLNQRPTITQGYGSKYVGHRHGNFSSEAKMLTSPRFQDLKCVRVRVSSLIVTSNDDIELNALGEVIDKKNRISKFICTF